MQCWTRLRLYIIIFLMLCYTNTTTSETSYDTDLSNLENFVDLEPIDLAIKEMEINFLKKTGLGDSRIYREAFAQAGSNLYGAARELASILYYIVRHPYQSTQAVSHFAAKTGKSVYDFSMLTDQEKVDHTVKVINTFKNYLADTIDNTSGPEITKNVMAFGIESVALVGFGKLFKWSKEALRGLVKDSTIIHEAQTARIAKNIHSLNYPWSNALTPTEIEATLRNINPCHQVNWNTLEKFTTGVINQGGVRGLESENSCLAKLFNFGHDKKHINLIKGSLGEIQAGAAFMEKGAILHEHSIKFTYAGKVSEIDWLVKLPGKEKLYAVEVKDSRVWAKYATDLFQKKDGRWQPDLLARNIFGPIQEQLSRQLPWAREQGYGFLFYSNFRLRPDVKLRFLYKGIKHVWHNPQLFEKHPFAAAAFARFIAGNTPDFAQPQLAFSVSFDDQEPAPAFTINEHSTEYEQDESLKSTFSKLFEGTFRVQEQGTPQNTHEEKFQQRFKKIFEQSKEEFFEDDYFNQFHDQQEPRDNEQEELRNSFQEHLKQESSRWYSQHHERFSEPPYYDESRKYNEWTILEGLTMVLGGSLAYTFSSTPGSSWSINITIQFLTEKGLLDVLLSAPVFYGILAASGYVPVTVYITGLQLLNPYPILSITLIYVL